ncbi:MAG TPA: hypothetical protein VMT98_19670 [Verrucomicrobiae bacterium]|nr:hypothetical protein [Verrucomicrobiae bacterium]
MSEITATTASIESPAAAQTERKAPVRPGRQKDDAPPFIPGEDLTFDDLVDFINPLHHLPVIGALYRAITGDQIKPALQIAGGTLFGGPSGFVSSTFQVLFQEMTGDDILGNGMAMLGLKEPASRGSAAAAGPGAAPVAAIAANPTATPAAPVAPSGAVDAAQNAVNISQAQDAYLRALAAKAGSAP